MDTKLLEALLRAHAASVSSSILPVAKKTLDDVGLKYAERDGSLIAMFEGYVVHVVEGKPCHLQVRFVSTSTQAPPQLRKRMAVHLNKQNWDNTSGKWCMDMSDGELSFVRLVAFHKRPSDESIRTYFFGVLKTAETEFLAGMNVIKAHIASGGSGLPEVSGLATIRGRTRGASNANVVPPPRDQSASLIDLIRNRQVDASSVQVLITRGADVNQRGEKGTTPLHIAAVNGLVGITRVLVDAGADLTARNNNNDSPLSLAVWKEQHDVAMLLVSRGHPVAVPDKFGDIPLLDAAKHGDLELVAALVKAGSPIDHTNHKGETALGHALDNNHVAVASYLQSVARSK